MQMRYTDQCTTAAVIVIYEKRLFAVLINFICQPSSGGRNIQHAVQYSNTKNEQEIGGGFGYQADP